MKPERAFIAERIAAQHCPELLRAGLSPAEMLPMLEKAGHRLSRTLGPALASMLGGKAPAVHVAAPRTIDAGDLGLLIAQLAANSMLAAGRQGTPILVSLEAGAVLRIVDRTFGGSGELSGLLPKEFPLSAEMVISRLETLIASQIAETLELRGDDAVRILRRNGNLDELAAFPSTCQLALVEFEVSGQDGEKLVITLALPMDRLVELFGHGERPVSVRREPANPTNEPFGDVQLSVQAVLVDMQLPMSVIANLEPGQILPVAVARKVPLRIGEKTIAEGAVGEIDDRVAIQITQAF